MEHPQASGKAKQVDPEGAPQLFVLPSHPLGDLLAPSCEACLSTRLAHGKATYGELQSHRDVAPS